MLKEYSAVLSIIARGLDLFAVISGALMAHLWRFGDMNLSANYQVVILLASLIALIFFPKFGLYQSWRGKSHFLHLRTLTSAWVSVLLILILIAFLTKTSTIFSRQWLVVWSFLSWTMMILLRVALGFALRKMREKGFNYKRIIILGAGDLGVEVLNHIKDAEWTGLKVFAFLDDDPEKNGSIVEGVEVFGSIDSVSEFTEKNGIDEVWIALPLSAEKRVKDILHALRHSTVAIRYVPDIFGFRLLNHSVTEIAGLAVMDLSVSPMTGINRLIKAIEDRLLAFIILVLVSPVLLMIAIAIKLTSPGPVLFKQYRHGWDGRPIKVYKFRTMHVHHEEPGKVTQASKQDSRVTKVGRVLRRTSLDELPQFFNVLQGRMSIVGPRPHAVEHNNQYKEQIDDYMKRHNVKPGITGWAQINGWRGETDTLDKMKKRVEYDLYYIEHWSLWFDLKIMLLTVFRGFFHRNAY